MMEVLPEIIGWGLFFLLAFILEFTVGRK